MNIQVDNPMNVLTQDAARKFLSASHPKEKYDFFLRGTQLSQLHEEYQASMKNLAASNKILEQRRADLPDLETQLQEAENRYKEANAARKLKLEIDDLKKELAWSFVKAKEDELSTKVEALAREENRLPRYQGSVTEAEAAFDSASEQVVQFENEYKDLGTIEHLHQRRRTIQEELRVNRNQISAFVGDERQMNSTLKGLNRQIEEYDTRIEEETQKLAADTQSKRDEVQRRLDAAKAAVLAAETNLKAIRDDRTTLQAEADVLQEEGSRLDRDIRNMQTNIQAQEAMVNNFAAQKRDQFAAFGKNMDALLTNIKKSRWHGDVPLGPLGVGVKVREDCKWATDVLRGQLGNILTAFAITNAKDMGPLKAMLQQFGNPSINVIIFEKDLFDFSRGEPPSDMLTVLRALEIPDPYALRIMINQLQIERTFLARAHEEAYAMAKAVGGGVSWTQNAQRVAAFSGGGGQTTQLNKLKRGDPHLALLTGRDVAQDALHFKEELRRLEQEYASLQTQHRQIRESWTQMKHKITALNRPEAAADAQLRNAKMTVDGIMQAMNDDLPANVAALEAAKKAAVTEKDSVLAQFSVLVEQKSKIDALQAPLLLEQNRIRADIDEFDVKAASIRSKVQQAVEARMHAQQSKEHYKGKLEAHKKKITDLEAQVQVLQEEFTNWTAKAEEFCPRVETERKPDEIDRKIQGLTRTLKTREQKQGASVEAVTIERDKAKARYDTVFKDINALSVMNKTLRDSLLIRNHRWVEFRRHIALRCKYVFQYNLSHRGYFGKVLFDHVAQTLTLKVQTEDAMGTQGGQDKDPRSLSGGEKSFSTICLLLSLWESIGCPLRCLDEFDVFMDAVNRRISMKMMIDTANSSDKKQYILITPQDMTNVQLGPTVKVNRMPDPERGQIAS
ncbi:hypothetical protein ONZ45_g4365 [Pleurotus djamor]|nr:hypothetical protein ONZ45_g4365 [Pleurotus djamor]